ncbi:response regulator [Balneolaceae bacterium ANBcel3]|nr:response regulator [Balneolaceae bacterium ANBcel3]
MKRIVLVEDDFIIALLLEKQIQRMGYVVADKIDNGEAAIETIKNNQPDLVLMDIKLVGDMDGIDAMNEIRKFSDIPVIYLTGNADENTKKRALKTRPEGYLIKPVDMEVLKKNIHEIMNSNIA